MSDIAVLPRLKPDPMPEIRPVPEYLAKGVLKAAYADTRAVLGVPWMGVVAMAFARYPGFYDALWRGMRPLARSRAFADACASLRARAEAVTADLAPAPLGARLAGLGYAPREIAAIRERIETFSRGNQPYLVMATLARLLLEGVPLSAGTDAPPALALAVEAASLVLIEPHHADAPTWAVYSEIMERLGLPFVNTDYRALARWPSYFSEAWAGLRPHPGTAGYEAAVQGLHGFAVETARALPNPGGLTPEGLRAAAAKDAPPEEILAVVRLFQWLLPGLVLNIAFFRAQLADAAG